MAALMKLNDRMKRMDSLMVASNAEAWEDGAMGSQILQNPSDPYATYREKAGNKNVVIQQTLWKLLEITVPS